MAHGLFTKWLPRRMISRQISTWMALHHEDRYRRRCQIAPFRLIAEVEAGQDVVITRRGRPVARLVPEPGPGSGRL